MRQFDTLALIELSQKLVKLDKKIKKTKGLGKEVKGEFKKLASMLEDALEDADPELSRNIHASLHDISARLEENHPELSVAVKKIVKYCKEAGI